MSAGAPSRFTTAAAAAVAGGVLASAALGALTTHSHTVIIEPGEYQPATAECAPGERIVSGGFESPNFEFPDGSRISVSSSLKRVRHRWSSAGLNGSPTVAGNLISYAYCEDAGLRLRTRRAETTIGAVSGATAKCRPGEWLVSGGFTAPDIAPDESIAMVRSHKRGQGWNVAGRVTSGPDMTLVAQAYCHPEAPRLRTVSLTRPVPVDTARSLKVACPRGLPLVAGGFVASEPPDSMSVYRSKRAGRQRWRVSGAPTSLTTGALTVEAYCRR